MIAWLRGRVQAIDGDSVILDVAGVGYRVHASARSLQRLPATGGYVELWIETTVREDAIILYGFESPSEQHWFRALRAVQGVGPRLALSLLSSLSTEELVRAIAAGDKTALTRASGVGPRLAGRIVAELRERLGTLMALPAATLKGPGDAAADAMAALIKLGFSRSEAFGAVTRARATVGADASVDQLLREALRELAP